MKEAPVVPVWLYHRDGSSFLFQDQARLDKAVASGEWADSPDTWPPEEPEDPTVDDAPPDEVDLLREKLTAAGVPFHRRSGLALLRRVAEANGIIT
jgi:hypothetical protein